MRIILVLLFFHFVIEAYKLTYFEWKRLTEQNKNFLPLRNHLSSIAQYLPIPRKAKCPYLFQESINTCCEKLLLVLIVPASSEWETAGPGIVCDYLQ